MNKFFRKIADLVRRYDDTHNFTCDVCGREVFGGERVCEKCRKTLPFNNGHICPFCGRKVLEPGVCIECKDHRPAVERARSCFTHEGDAAALVVRFKKGQKYLYRTLCDFLEPQLKREFPEADLLTFVPMTKRAERKRGYNQSRLLAEELARRSGLAMLPLAEKQHETASQKTLGRREREKNLEGAFHVTDRAAAKRRKIVIIDDTFTTGSTVSELAGALLRAGAAAVFALTVTSVQYKIVKPKEK